VSGDPGTPTDTRIGESGRRAEAAVPLVSVVVPCFDAADTIERAIRSARGQTHPAVELIAVDDASGDDTLARLEALSGDDLRVLALERNVGAAEARNRGLALARGDYVAFLDADDEWLPDKLRIQVEALERDPTLVLSTCDSILVGVDGSTIRHHDTTDTASGPEAWRTLLRGNFVPTPTVVARRSALEAVGGFDADLALGEDYDVWLKLSARGGFHVHPEVLLRIYARHAGLSRTLLRGELDYVVPMLERHLAAFADRLSPAEVRAIRGHNCFDIGLRARQSGFHAEAAPLFRASIAGRHRVVKSVYHLLRCWVGQRSRAGRGR